MTIKLWTYWCVAATLACAGTSAMAAAYKCTNPGGGISYSDTPCPTTASKGEKLLGRGAGSNPLNEEEKSAFKAAVMSDCKAPRIVCECVSDYLADALTYEEILEAGRRKSADSVDIQNKTKRALAQCKPKP